MSYTRIEWCQDFLFQLGNRTPSPAVLNWLDGWTVLESVPPGAMYNLLNTTQREPGSTDFNTTGVQNFVSFSQGIQANITVLTNGLYPNLYHALLTNDIASLTGPTPAITSELKLWCGGCDYAPTIAQVAGQRANDEFPGVDPLLVAQHYIDQAAHDTWFSNGRNLPYTTGIASAWRDKYLTGRNMAPANGPEFKTVKWDGTPIIAQLFGPDRCEWEQGAPTWYKVGL